MKCYNPAQCNHFERCNNNGICKAFVDSFGAQPNPTPQVPAAPTLEQVADSEFELWQDDCCMACTSGPREAALRDILHYAMVYGQDGPVNVYEVKRTLITHE